MEKKWGTSSIVVAAFVGPGTVLTCASAGVDFGYGLGWVLLFATAATYVLQSFTASTGILARKGLGEAVRETFTTPIARPLSFGLVILGLWVGCAAFEMGNLMGAASGIAALISVDLPIRWMVLAIGLIAALLLLLEVKVLVRVFSALVLGMSGLFVIALLLSPVDWGAALAGLFVPRVPSGSLVRVVALIGTTIVTYNLFLHASVTKRYWADTPDTAHAWHRERRGMLLFIPLGGFISFAILATGATLAGTGAELNGIAGFSALLEPVAGKAAGYLFGIGLFSAGITSAMTAPLAAAEGIRELFGWPEDNRSRRYRLLWGSVILTGLIFGMLGISPLPAIIAAQAANGVLLPLIAAFMLYLTLRQTALPLSPVYKILGIGVTVVCAVLGARTLWWVWHQIGG